MKEKSILTLNSFSIEFEFFLKEKKKCYWEQQDYFFELELLSFRQNIIILASTQPHKKNSRPLDETDLKVDNLEM